MPNPFDRLLGDVVTAVTTIATTFDPQQSNTKLLRTLLSIGLTELGIEDAAAAVERIYPPGYIAPATAAAAGSVGASLRSGRPSPASESRRARPRRS